MIFVKFVVVSPHHLLPNLTIAAAIIAQVTAIMQWIPLIHCIANLTYTLSNYIPKRQEEIF